MRQIKINIMGSCKVGKTAICQVLCGKRFPTEYQPTLCVDLSTFEDAETKLYIWELSGADKYRSLITPYMNRSEVGIFVYDITDITTLSDLDYYIKTFRGPTRILVANKCDRTGGGAGGAGEEYATQHGMLYFETSAKDNKGIKELFSHLAQQQGSVTDPSIWLTGSIVTNVCC